MVKLCMSFDNKVSRFDDLRRTFDKFFMYQSDITHERSVELNGDGIGDMVCFDISDIKHDQSKNFYDELKFIVGITTAKEIKHIHEELYG